MEIKAKVIQHLAPQTGTSKNGSTWSKQEIILETYGQYPKKVCISIWGDKINATNYAIGNDIIASVDPESREYNGRWYTDIRAWKIELAGTGQPTNTPIPAVADTNASFVAAPTAPLSANDAPMADDDLPF